MKKIIIKRKNKPRLPVRVKRVRTAFTASEVNKRELAFATHQTKKEKNTERMKEKEKQAEKIATKTMQNQVPPKY